MAIHHLPTATTLLLLVLRSAAVNLAPSADGMFVFGSSLVDNGNNNFLNTTAKANYFPYGIDSSMGPSGRFSNGKNMIDAFGELLGLRGPIPPFLHPRTAGHAIAHGVNYASGGSGILDETGAVGGRVMSLGEQITHFEATTLPELKRVLSHRGRDVDLSRYLFVVGTGGNDYLLNYYLKNKGDGSSVSLERFTDQVIATLYSHLKRLHRLGARKFILMSVQAIGCVPVVRAAQHLLNSSSCVETVNRAAVVFNARLRSLVDAPFASHDMPSSHLIYVNSYDIIMDLFHSPRHKGFRETRKACCEVEWRNGILCRQGGRTCGDRQAHVFFDGLHPTEAVNLRVAKRAYKSRRHADVYPINVKQLARI